MEKILVVDDDVDMLTILQQALTKAGYLVSTLSDGKEVLPVVHRFHPDLIIFDINLGDTDGRERCHQIKRIEDFQHLPIILYSSEDFPNLNVADCKADAFVFKPFSMSYMLGIINKLITSSVLTYPCDVK